MEVDEYRRMADVEHSHWWYQSTRDLLREILDVDTARGGRFLDVGAGTGNSFDIYVEVVGSAESSSSSGGTGGIFHDVVQLYR